MTTLERVLEMAARAGYQLLGGADRNGSGYALGCLHTNQPIGIFKTLEEVLDFLSSQI